MMKRAREVPHGYSPFAYNILPGSPYAFVNPIQGAAIQATKKNYWAIVGSV